MQENCGDFKLISMIFAIKYIFSLVVYIIYYEIIWDNKRVSVSTEINHSLITESREEINFDFRKKNQPWTLTEIYLQNLVNGRKKFLSIFSRKNSCGLQTPVPCGQPLIMSVPLLIKVPVVFEYYYVCTQIIDLRNLEFLFK